MNSRIVQIAVVFLTFIVAVFRITEGSESIILHWDFGGNITSYGSKYYIIFLPIVSSLLYMIFQKYAKDPYRMNCISKIAVTSNNTKALVRYIHIVAPLVLVVLLYVTLCSAQIMELQPLFIITIICVVILFYVYTYRRIEK